jgi:hypothetical protein
MFMTRAFVGGSVPDVTGGENLATIATSSCVALETPPDERSPEEHLSEITSYRRGASVLDATRG